MTDEQIRGAVLEIINKQRKASRHEREIKMRLSQIERDIRNEGYAIDDKQVLQAVNYLTETKMIKRTQETKTIKPMANARRPLRSRPPTTKHTVYYYTLTAQSIDRLEGETEYSKKSFVPLQSINITAVNAPVVIGSNNTVESNVSLFNQLDKLQQALSEADDLDVDARRDVAGDIESLKQQIAKPNPNATVVDALWQSIGRVADLAGVAGLAVQIAKGIAAITGN